MELTVLLAETKKMKHFEGKLLSIVDGDSCRNHYNYMNKKLSKWVGVYDNAKRKQQSGWSENDVLVKAQEIYSGSKNEYFNLMSE